jgi:hypothetical protein
MRKIQFPDGGMPMTLDHIKYLQNTMSILTHHLLLGISNTDSNASPIILYGCEITETDDTISTTFGAIWAENEIYTVGAHSISKNIGDVGGWVYDEIEPAEGTYEFGDLTIHNVYKETRMKLVAEADDYALYLPRFSDLIGSQEELNSLAAQHSALNVKYHDWVVKNGSAYFYRPPSGASGSGYLPIAWTKKVGVLNDNATPAQDLYLQAFGLYNIRFVGGNPGTVRLRIGTVTYNIYDDDNIIYHNTAPSGGTSPLSGFSTFECNNQSGEIKMIVQLLGQ